MQVPKAPQLHQGQVQISGRPTQQGVAGIARPRLPGRRCAKGGRWLVLLELAGIGLCHGRVVCLGSKIDRGRTQIGIDNGRRGGFKFGIDLVQAAIGFGWVDTCTGDFGKFQDM